MQNHAITAKKSPNMSQTAEDELSVTVTRQRHTLWLEENKASLVQWNKWVEENGLPLSEYRDL